MIRGGCYCRRLCSSLSPAVAAAGGNYDVVIAGGGIMGCSSAYYLAQRMPPNSICIVERDPTYKRASTVLSAASIRQQFSIKGNVLMSLSTFHFLKNAASYLRVEGEDPPDVQLHEDGYLFLASEEGEGVMQENHALQRSLGAAVVLKSPQDLQRQFPWLNTEGIKLASLGERNEGWFDSWMLLNALKKKVLSMGVRILEANITDVSVENNKVEMVKVASSGGETEIRCGHLVNAAGAWGAKLALMAGIGDENQTNPVLRVPLPVSPRKRCIFAFKCPSGPGSGSPLVVDVTGMYFRREGSGSMYITGVSPPEELDVAGEDFSVDHSLFEETLWPLLAKRVPAFEALKVQSAWAGLYEYNTLDQNAIIGQHPVISNFIFINGFSGHGLQQFSAAGRAVSEVLLDGRTHSIDLGEFSFERVVNNRPLREKNVV